MPNTTLTIPQRSEYLSGAVNHETFYTSVAREAGIYLTQDYDLIDKVRHALEAGDEHLNTIPLANWDGMAWRWKDRISSSLKLHGDTWSVAGGVCTMKAAARAAAKAADMEEPAGPTARPSAPWLSRWGGRAGE